MQISSPTCTPAAWSRVITLGHHRHVFFERHVRQRPRWAALAAEDGLEITAAKAVHRIVADREAAAFDHAGGVDDLLHRRTVPGSRAIISVSR
jgi:hypothetical protein